MQVTHKINVEADKMQYRPANYENCLLTLVQYCYTFSYAAVSYIFFDKHFILKCIVSPVRWQNQGPEITSALLRLGS